MPDSFTIPCSVRRIFQARRLGRVAISFFTPSFWPYLNPLPHSNSGCLSLRFWEPTGSDEGRSRAPSGVTPPTPGSGKWPLPGIRTVTLSEACRDPEVPTTEHFQVPPEVVWVLLYFFYLNKYVPQLLSAKQKDAFSRNPLLPQLCEMNDNLWSSVGLDEP